MHAHKSVHAYVCVGISTRAQLFALIAVIKLKTFVMFLLIVMTLFSYIFFFAVVVHYMSALSFALGL